MQAAIVRIEAELQERLAWFEKEGKLLEAQRLRMRTQYDLEMMQEVGFCNGIENYSAPIDGRGPGEAPNTLLDFFPEGLPARPRRVPRQTCPSSTASTRATGPARSTLIEHGFRLPSAADNRPLRFDEFIERVSQVVFLSATPGPYELEHSTPGRRADRAARPASSTPRSSSSPPRARSTTSWSRSTSGSTDGDRVLVTTLTKKMAEDLTDYLLELGVRVRYLHSEVDTIQRIEILRDLRLGEFDVLVGINLLREGLDLPEVSLVAILDADKEGFLRSETSLIQTIGRAARNVDGQVIMYADKVTDSMQRAISRDQPPPRASSRPTTTSTASTRRRSARRSPTSSPTCARPRRRRCPGKDQRDRRRDEQRIAQRPGRAARATSWPGSSTRSRRRCTRRPPTSASSTPPASATRSRTSSGSCARWAEGRRERCR